MRWSSRRRRRRSAAPWTLRRCRRWPRRRHGGSRRPSRSRRRGNGCTVRRTSDRRRRHPRRGSPRVIGTSGARPAKAASGSARRQRLGKRRASRRTASRAMRRLATGGSGLRTRLPSLSLGGLRTSRLIHPALPVFERRSACVTFVTLERACVCVAFATSSERRSVLVALVAVAGGRCKYIVQLRFGGSFFNTPLCRRKRARGAAHRAERGSAFVVLRKSRLRTCPSGRLPGAPRRLRRLH